MPRGHPKIVRFKILNDCFVVLFPRSKFFGKFRGFEKVPVIGTGRIRNVLYQSVEFGFVPQGKADGQVHVPVCRKTIGRSGFTHCGGNVGGEEFLSELCFSGRTAGESEDKCEQSQTKPLVLRAANQQ